MRRGLRSSVAFVIMAVVLFLAADTVQAAPAGKDCPTFSKAGVKYLVATVGTGFTCQSAVTWTLKLIHDHVNFSVAGRQTLHNGPGGYLCVATNALKGDALDGQCYKGSQAYPTSGFGWGPAPP